MPYCDKRASYVPENSRRGFWKKTERNNMTVEQLNVIVTAQISDFSEKINKVNNSLKETISLAERAADTVMGIDVQAPSEEGFSRSFTAVDTTDITEKAERSSSASGEYGKISSATANVLSLRSGETLIGAVSEGNEADKGFMKPVEIHTTVELDGEKVGEAVNTYNNSRLRVLNGKNG